MRNITEKIVEKIQTKILYSITPSRNRAVYGKLWKNAVKPDRTRWQHYAAHALSMLDT